MAERTMEELLRAPTEGYGEAICFKTEIKCGFNLEIKTNLLQLVQANPFYGREISWMLRKNPETALTANAEDADIVRSLVGSLVKLGIFRVGSIFPPSKTTHLKNEISRFTQKFEETFSEAWERFKEMLRACPHHGFTELTQVDTFYNGLNENEQDSLNVAVGLESY
ncbi:reverse transcriptase domain-containing protein [Tanacetum coccineum]